MLIDKSVVSAAGDVMAHVFQTVLGSLHIVVQHVRLMGGLEVMIVGLMVHWVAVALVMVRTYPHIGSWNSHCFNTILIYYTS